MASSPESGANASDVSHGGARTPTNNPKSRYQSQPQSQFAGSSELSPPGSQPSKLPGVSGIAAGNSGGVSGPEAQRPGASWMNKRAHEEYDWAMGSVVDKDFSLKEFGDPFDERDMEGRV
ncbi:hypothetical protein PHISP_06645 [Aspergillus sp. HF37]|nr:hypothetical protein PHISP_06645 [Aspergillus sp. HF37]